MNLRKITALFTAFALTASATMADFAVPVAYAEEAVTGEWYEADGAWYYRNGPEDVDWISSLGLDLSGVSDWSEIKYISADVTVEGTTQALVSADLTGAEDDSGWKNGNPVTVTDDTVTVYFNTNGEVIHRANVDFWWYDTEKAVSANAVIKVSDITFSTEERDYSNVTGEWYEQNGAWHYKHGTQSEIPSLSIDTDGVDWSAVKYVSADVTANLNTELVMSSWLGGWYTADPDTWVNNPAETLENGVTTTVYFETNGADLGCLEVLTWRSTNDVELNEGTEITVSNIVFSEEEMPDPVNEWYEEDGVWYFNCGESDIPEGEVPNFEISLPEGVTWENLKYVTADVVVNGAVDSMRLNVERSDGTYKDGSTISVGGGNTNCNVLLITNGEVWDRLSFGMWSVSAGATLAVSNFEFSVEKYDYSTLLNEWYTDEGAHYYRNGSEDAEWIPSLELDLSGVSDWSEIKYISADVTVEGTIQPLISADLTGADDDSGWKNGNPVNVTDNTVTVYFNTNGKEIHRANVDFWWYDTEKSVSANAVIKVSNITFSTEERDYSNVTGEWNEINGAWCYKHGTQYDVPNLIIDLDGVDWSAVKYVSVDVTASTTAQPCFGGWYNADPDTWVNGSPKFMGEGGKSTVYYETNGDDLGGLELQFWEISAGVNLNEGTEITVSNIVFSTEDRDYSDTIGEWYEKDGAWHYKHGTENIIPNLPIDVSSVDWSALQYVSVDVSANGTLQPVFGANDADINWSNGIPSWIQDNGETTIYFETNGEVFDCIEVCFWDRGIDMAADEGTEITVSNIVFSTEALPKEYIDPGVTGEWVNNGDGSFSYKHGTDKSVPPLFIDTEDVDWSTLMYVSADVVTSDTAHPVFGAAIKGVEDSWTDGENVWMGYAGKATVYYETNGVEMADLSLRFWGISDSVTLNEGTIITVKNIVYSTEKLPAPVGEWYEKDGVWYYTHGTNATVPNLPFTIEGDWSTIKYVSADVTASSTAQPCFGGWFTADPDAWVNGTSVWMDNGGKATVYYEINGQDLGYLELMFWGISDDIVLAEGTEITVSNITVSDEEISGPVDEWYEVDGVWHYKHGSNTSVPVLEINLENIDWAAAEYVSVNVTASDTAQPVLGGCFADDPEGWSYGLNEFIAGGGEATVCFETNGAELSYLSLDFWQIADGVVLNEGTELTVSSLAFSEEELPDPVDRWYSPEEGVYVYQDSGNGNEMEHLFFGLSDTDLSKVKYATVDLEVDGQFVSDLTFSSGNGALYAGNPYTFTSGENTVYAFNYEGRAWEDLDLYGWSIEPGTKITASNLKLYTEEIKDYENIVGQWIQTGENSYYYNHGDLSESYYDTGIRLTASDYDLSKVQSATVTMHYVSESESAPQIGIGGFTDDGGYSTYALLACLEETSVTREFYGKYVSDMSISGNYMSPGTKLYISDVTFGTDPVELAETTEFEKLIDNNETSFTAPNGQHTILWGLLSDIDSCGTLRFKVEPIENKDDEHYINAIWNDWSATGGWKVIYPEPVVVTEDGWLEIPITEETLKMLHETAADQCALLIQGYGVKVSEFILNNIYVDEENILRWNDVENAEKYILKVRGTDVSAEYEVPYASDYESVFAALEKGTYYIDVYYVADGAENLISSINYTAATPSVKVGNNTFYYEKTTDGIAIIGSEIADAEVIIPAEISDTAVTSIGSEAFRSDVMTSVTIPAGVNTIEGGAFAFNTKLTEIKCDENNKFFIAENGILFSRNKKTLVAYPSGKTGAYVVPTTVTIIGDSAFYGTAVTSVTILSSVNSIGFEAFAECADLSAVTFSDGVSYVGYKAFANCASLKTITVPETVTNIGDMAFGFNVQDDNAAVYEGFTLSGKSGSMSEAYASRHGIPFTALGESSESPFDEESKQEVAVEALGGEKIEISPSVNMKDKEEMDADFDFEDYEFVVEEIEDDRKTEYKKHFKDDKVKEKAHCFEFDLKDKNGHSYGERFDGLFEMDIPMYDDIKFGYSNYHLYRMENYTRIEIIGMHVAKGGKHYYRVYLEHFSDYVFVNESVEEEQIAPYNVKAELSGGKIVLSWDKTEGAASYDVYRSIGENGTKTKLASVTTESYTDTAVVQGKTFCYFIIAHNEDKSLSSDYSDEVNVTIPENNISAFVERLYATMLGRESDVGGKAKWIQKFNGGATAADVAVNFVLSPELKQQKLSNEKFVTRMYQTMLDRTPAEKEIANWASYLEAGCTYAFIFRGFLTAPEFSKLCSSYGIKTGTYAATENRDVNGKLTKFISRLYTKALNRAYDVG
ncbi:MAG: leucine-rich repeat protein, partial [Ruminiclostridium sp.]|nr:leucine-rich repeat protein [Ruminiclostridium sp.]